MDIHDIETRLWDAADELRANSHLKASEYSVPVLGLIFLKYADSRFTQLEAELAGKASNRREIGKADYQSRGVLYLPGTARSLRSGLATAAAAGGAPERAIMRQTGHRSVEMVRRYIRAGSLFQENAAAYVGL